MTSEQELRDRVEAYLADTALGGPEICETISVLSSTGRVAIFGGMIRDLARGGAEAFRSDVDLVVDCEAEDLDRLVQDLPVTRNRFGGYRLTGKRFAYDVWALPNTWAIRQGHVVADGLADLIKTTFFDCDAVVYERCSRTIHWSDGYLERLHAQTVDINLEDNPNRVGTLARALRILLEWRQGLGPQLTWYLCQGLSEMEREVVHYARRSKPLGSIQIGGLARQLWAHDVSRPFSINQTDVDVEN